MKLGGISLQFQLQLPLIDFALRRRGHMTCDKRDFNHAVGLRHATVYRNLPHPVMAECALRFSSSITTDFGEYKLVELPSEVYKLMECVDGGGSR